MVLRYAIRRIRAKLGNVTVVSGASELQSNGYEHIHMEVNFWLTRSEFVIEVKSDETSNWEEWGPKNYFYHDNKIQTFYFTDNGNINSFPLVVLSILDS